MTAHPRLLIAALGCAQIVSWGTLYYGFSLFVLPMASELGWSLTRMNGALSLGLLVAGACAYPVGAFIDRHGGRALMTAGSIAAALLLIVWSQVTTWIAFYLVWFALGACLAAVLYEPVFVVLTQLFGAQARRAITALTLIAGFASTVMVPAIELLLGHIHWRSVLLVLALLNLVVCVPVHGLLLPRSPPAHATPAAAPDLARTVLHAHLRNPVFWGLALWFTAYAGTGTGLIFQLVPYLKAQGVETALMLGAIALIGPSQVAGRLLLMGLGERADLVVVGAITTSAMPLAVVILALAPPTAPWLALFACLYGAANGVTTILRGAVPPEWLGRDEIGRVMGALGAPMLIVSALAPLAAAALWSATGSGTLMLAAIAAFACVGMGGFWWAALHQLRARRSDRRVA